MADNKLYCLVTEAHVCKQLAQGCTRQPGFEPRDLLVASPALTTRPPSHTLQQNKWKANVVIAVNPDTCLFEKQLLLWLWWWTLTIKPRVSEYGGCGRLWSYTTGADSGRQLMQVSTFIHWHWSLGIFQSVKVKSIQCKPTVQQDGKTRGFGFHGIGKKCGFGFGSVTVPPLLIIVVYYAKGVTNTHTIFLNIKIA